MPESMTLMHGPAPSFIAILGASGVSRGGGDVHGDAHVGLDAVGAGPRAPQPDLFLDAKDKVDVVGRIAPAGAGPRPGRRNRCGRRGPWPRSAGPGRQRAAQSRRPRPDAPGLPRGWWRRCRCRAWLAPGSFLNSARFSGAMTPMVPSANCTRPPTSVIRSMPPMGWKRRKPFSST